MTPFIKFLLLFSVFLIPLLPASSFLGYEQIKVLFFILSMTMAGFLWMGKGFKWTAISKMGGIFILILMMTSLLGAQPLTSILGTQPYFQGAILYVYLFLFYLLVKESKIKLEVWSKILVLSAILVSLVAIKDWVLLNLFSQQVPLYAGRVVSTFGQPNFYAGFILLTLPFFHLLLTKKGLRWWIVLGFLISITAIILSQSRIAYFLLAGLILIWLIKKLVRQKWLMLYLSLIIIIVATALSFFFSSGLFWKEVIEPISSTDPDRIYEIGVEKRAYFLPIMGQLILQSPIKGYGLENIYHVFSGFFETNKNAPFESKSDKQAVLLKSLKDLSLDRSHNYILDLLLFSGIFGLLGYLGLVGLMLNKTRGVLMTSLILYLIWVQFQNQSVVQLIYFWLLTGLIDKD